MADPVIELIQQIRRDLINLRRRANDSDTLPPEVVTEALRDLTVTTGELEERARDAAAERHDLALLYRHEHHEHYRDFFEAAPEALLVTDRSGILEEANQAARQLLGADQRDLVRQPLARLVAEDDRRVVWRAVRGGRDRDERGPWRLTVVPYAGEPFPATIAVTAGRDPERLYWTVHDVTAEQRQAGELGRARVRDVRTEEARQAFFLAMAHDLRSPVNGLLAGVRAVEARGDELPDAVRGALASVVENAEELRRLRTQFFDLERLGRGAVHARRRRTDLAELVEQTAKAVDLGDRSLHLDLDQLEVEVDPGLTESVLRNLLENAARHTPPLTRVWVRLETGDDESVVLTVEDDGPGVPADRRDNIFDMFGRLDPDDHSGGMGAGLYLVRRFVHLQRGRTWVEAREGGGASFKIVLPRA